MQTSFKPTAKLIIFLLMTVFISACRRDSNTDIPVISCSDINSDVVWKDRGDGIDYILNCVVTVNAKLTIEPGVNIQVKSGAGILVETGGSIVAVGTETKNIIFKDPNDAAGVWKGIYIKSNNVLNELKYCIVSNGGASSFDGNTTKLANIRLALNSKLKLHYTTVAKSAKDGLLIDGLDGDETCPVTYFKANAFIGNLNYPISAIASLGKLLDAETTYTGNTYNKILFRGGRLYGSHIWLKQSVPYLIQSIVSVGYYSDNGNLTIKPGTVIQFAGDAGLCTGDYSTDSWLNIEGSASERVTLTGETAAPGAWKGIAFQSLSPNNAINYADISYGGSSSYTGATQKRANIHGGAWSAGTFSIANSTINNSAAWGIWINMASPNVTVPASVTYSGNASGNYYKE